MLDAASSSRKPEPRARRRDWFDRLLLGLQTGLLISALLSLLWVGYQAWQNPFVEAVVTRSAEELREAVWLRVEQKFDQGELDQRLRSALDQEPVAWTEVDLTLALAERFQLTPDPELATAVASARKDARRPVALLGDCFRGIFGLDLGQGLTEASCAGVSEVTSVGDIKSILRAAGAAASGQQIDRFDLGLGIAGLALTGATLVSAGTAAPAKAGVVTVKLAKRARALSPGLERHLQKRLAHSVHLDRALKELASQVGKGLFVQGASLQSRAVKIAKASIDPKAFDHLARDLADLGVALQRVGPGSALYTLRFVGSGQDIARLKRFSEAMGKETPHALSVLGRAGYRLSVKTLRTGVRLTKTIGLLVWNVVALVFSLALSFLKWLVSAWLKRARRARRLA